MDRSRTPGSVPAVLARGVPFGRWRVAMCAPAHVSRCSLLPRGPAAGGPGQWGRLRSIRTVSAELGSLTSGCLGFQP